jgi:hypothetical protein
MLHEILKDNRAALIGRCRRTASASHSIPLILDQLVEALAGEQRFPTLAVQTIRGDSADPPAWRDSSGTSATALRGAEIHKLGDTLARLVHDYGDLCQAFTDVAMESHAGITVKELDTFNRVLQDSIANALSAFRVRNPQGSVAKESRNLLDAALEALDVLKSGEVGLMGPTSALIEQSLRRLHELNESLPSPLELQAEAHISPPGRG